MCPYTTDIGGCLWGGSHSCVTHLVIPLNVLPQYSLCEEEGAVVGTIAPPVCF